MKTFILLYCLSICLSARFLQDNPPDEAEVPVESEEVNLDEVNSFDIKPGEYKNLTLETNPYEGFEWYVMGIGYSKCNITEKYYIQYEQPEDAPPTGGELILTFYCSPESEIGTVATLVLDYKDSEELDAEVADEKEVTYTIIA